MVIHRINMNLDFMKPALVVAIMWGITISNVTDILKLFSAIIAIAYTIWKWRADVQKHKAGKV